MRSIFRNAYFLQPLFWRLYVVADLVTLKPDNTLNSEIFFLLWSWLVWYSIILNLIQFSQLNLSYYTSSETAVLLLGFFSFFLLCPASVSGRSPCWLSPVDSRMFSNHIRVSLISCFTWRIFRMCSFSINFISVSKRLFSRKLILKAFWTLYELRVAAPPTGPERDIIKPT